jgi:hypothetical protein
MKLRGGTHERLQVKQPEKAENSPAVGQHVDQALRESRI